MCLLPVEDGTAMSKSSSVKVSVPCWMLAHGENSGETYALCHYEGRGELKEDPNMYKSRMGDLYRSVKEKDVLKGPRRCSLSGLLLSSQRKKLFKGKEYNQLI